LINEASFRFVLPLAGLTGDALHFTVVNNNIAHMQDVRNFLTEPNITIAGKPTPTLCFFFSRLTKALQAGHICNVAPAEIVRIVLSPELGASHQLLNVSLAFVCDVVHWGLCDLARKITNPTDNVCKYFQLY
jgi:hypothetical protein